MNEFDREQERVEALRAYGLLGEPIGPEIDAIVRLAAHVAGVSTATLNVIDSHHQCQLASVGFEGGKTDRADSMCALGFRNGRFVYVPDTHRHPAYQSNPWVTGRLGLVRFYASVPVISPDGHALGSICVFDDAPRELGPEQIERLTDLARLLISVLEVRRTRRLEAARG